MPLSDEILNSLEESIVTILTAAVPVGVSVHGYFRLSKDDAAQRALMQSEEAGGIERLHCWMVSLDPSDTGFGKYLGSSQEQMTFKFAMHGWLAVKDADATERTWRTQVIKVVKAFQAAPKLNRGTGGNGDVIESGPVQIANIDYRRVPPETGILCHYARLTYDVRVQARP